jgi:hypothetical protein
VAKSGSTTASPSACNPIKGVSSTPKNMVITSPMFDDSRYRRNLRMFAKIARPSSTAATMEAKLSSARIMSATAFATSVPVIPIAMPMSADFRAGASLTPSPVMATTAPWRCSAFTIRSLRSGLTRA